MVRLADDVSVDNREFVEVRRERHYRVYGETPVSSQRCVQIINHYPANAALVVAHAQQLRVPTAFPTS